MKLLAVLLFISQLLYINALLPTHIVPTVPPIPIDCDNLELQVAVDFTLRKFNTKGTTGHKYGLHRITYATEQRTIGSRYFIKFDIQESDCLVGSKKSWKDCGYRTSENTTNGQCESNVYINNHSIVEVTSYKCTLKPVSNRQFGQRASFPGGKTLVPHDDPKIQELLHSSVTKINNESNSSHLFVPGTIYTAVKQVVSGMLFMISFAIHETGCTKNSTIVPKDCPVQQDRLKTLYCKSTLHSRPWLNARTLSVSCGDEMIDIIPKKQEFQISPGMGAIRGASVEATPGEQVVKTPIGTDAPSQMPDLPKQQLRDLPESKIINCPGQPWKPLRQPSLAIPPTTSS
ncbi:kininogen-1-like isoform X2 [Callorhinchus milii]|uniref:kininogen-1-like isoform X2 n=1 Tax=Callorhinchus milii TaxID=7868 RepID=UPI001C3FB3D9|nr:kininogen-1-like isoform X2 [Callorhinchus milii]